MCKVSMEGIACVGEGFVVCGGLWGLTGFFGGWGTLIPLMPQSARHERGTP